MCGGHYVHFPNWISGLKKVIKESGLPQNKSDSKIDLLINNDGLPLFRHSPDYNLHPILITVHGIQSRPVCARIYCSGKCLRREMPPPDKFLSYFLKDIFEIYENSIIVNGSKFSLNSYGIFVCDAPARSSVLNLTVGTAVVRDVKFGENIIRIGFPWYLLQ